MESFAACSLAHERRAAHSINKKETSCQNGSWHNLLEFSLEHRPEVQTKATAFVYCVDSVVLNGTNAGSVLVRSRPSRGPSQGERGNGDGAGSRRLCRHSPVVVDLTQWYARWDARWARNSAVFTVKLRLALQLDLRFDARLCAEVLLRLLQRKGSSPKRRLTRSSAAWANRGEDHPSPLNLQTIWCRRGDSNPHEG